MNKKKKTRMTQNDIKTAKRLLKYVTEKYKLQFILVFICILDQCGCDNGSIPFSEIPAG